MITEKSWEEFLGTGLFVFINSFLHIFGWALVAEVEDDLVTVVRVYPARVKFRGFSHPAAEEGYKKLTAYMKAAAPELLDEVYEGEKPNGQS